MTGLLLLVVGVLWLVAAISITGFVVWKIPGRGWRLAVAVVVFPALVVLPLADEIIGGWQFNALCEEKTAIRVDETRAAGRRVFLLSEAPITVPGVLVPVTEQPFRFADVDTKEILISYSLLRAKGGWLMRTLGVSETDSPITFRRSCGPPDPSTIFSDLNIEQVQRKDLRRAEPK
jgi:hypothetical protein